MSLYGMQKFLYHLNRDPRVQTRYRDDRAALLGEYPLTEEERSAIDAGDIGLIYVLGANGQLPMHFAAYLGMPWPADRVPQRLAIVGTGGLSHRPATPDSGKINEAWDREFLDRWSRNDKAALLSQDTYTDAQCYREAGQGAFEIRTLIAVAAAARGPGAIRHSQPIPIFAVNCMVGVMEIV